MDSYFSPAAASRRFGKAFVVAIAGMGGTYLYVRRHQERRRRRPVHQTIDDLFAGDLFDRLLMPMA